MRFDSRTRGRPLTQLSRKESNQFLDVIAQFFTPGDLFDLKVSGPTHKFENLPLSGPHSSCPPTPRVSLFLAPD